MVLGDERYHHVCRGGPAAAGQQPVVRFEAVQCRDKFREGLHKTRLVFPMQGKAPSLQQASFGQGDCTGANSPDDAEAVVSLDQGDDSRVSGSHLRVPGGDEDVRGLVLRIKPSVHTDGDARGTGNGLTGGREHPPMIERMLRQLVGNAQWFDRRRKRQQGKTGH